MPQLTPDTRPKKDEPKKVETLEKAHKMGDDKDDWPDQGE